MAPTVYLKSVILPYFPKKPPYNYGNLSQFGCKQLNTVSPFWLYVFLQIVFPEDQKYTFPLQYETNITYTL